MPHQGQWLYLFSYFFFFFCTFFTTALYDCTGEGIGGYGTRCTNMTVPLMSEGFQEGDLTYDVCQLLCQAADQRVSSDSFCCFFSGNGICSLYANSVVEIVGGNYYAWTCTADSLTQPSTSPSTSPSLRQVTTTLLAASEDAHMKVQPPNTVDAQGDFVELGTFTKAAIQFQPEIPPGQSLVGAVLVVTPSDTDSVSQTFSIRVENVSNAQTFKEIEGWVDTLELSATSIAWSLSPWTSQDMNHSTANLKPLFDAVGWSSGQRITFVLTQTEGPSGFKRCYSLESMSIGPMLRLSYEQSSSSLSPSASPFPPPSSPIPQAQSCASTVLCFIVSSPNYNVLGDFEVNGSAVDELVPPDLNRLLIVTLVSYDNSDPTSLTINGDNLNLEMHKLAWIGLGSVDVNDATPTLWTVGAAEPLPDRLIIRRSPSIIRSSLALYAAYVESGPHHVPGANLQFNGAGGDADFNFEQSELAQGKVYFRTFSYSLFFSFF